ncbi:MAG: putative addiction module antidote protein [Treponema sp.]|jgi:probable addiction module antidote protein|nr:putative addiction module antidote protein [Treponema sp.]
MELHEWDMAENINTSEEVYAYLQVALAENDTETLFDVIGAIARSKGMVIVAKELGLSRESLYKSLSPSGNPSFSTVLKVLDLLGYRLQILPKNAA